MLGDLAWPSSTSAAAPRGREAFAQPAGLPRHHLYVCPAGNTALANHLAIRDIEALNQRPDRAQGESTP